jgi:hypothetical protein
MHEWDGPRGWFGDPAQPTARLECRVELRKSDSVSITHDDVAQFVLQIRVARYPFQEIQLEFQPAHAATSFCGRVYSLPCFFLYFFSRDLFQSRGI